MVATSAASIPELIRSGSDGLLVEPRDSAALARAIRAQLADQEHAGRMALSARTRVLQHFNIHTEVTKLLAVWQHACATSPRGLASACQEWLSVTTPSPEAADLTHS